MSQKNLSLEIANIQTEFNQRISDLQKDLHGFSELAGILKALAGINLPENPKNLALMATRLNSVLSDFKIDKYKDFVKEIRKGNEKAKEAFILAMTTNTTEFFRESGHFDVLRQNLKTWISQKRKKHDLEFRIWCAASSSGQEVYSLLITLFETLGEDIFKIKIKFLATDIDIAALTKASTGIYTAAEVKNLSPIQLQGFFNRVLNKDEELYQVRREYIDLVRFARFNLIQPSYPFQHKFDLIFCRNVLIYFDSFTTATVVKKLGDSLRVGGHLFIGHSEAGAMRLNGFSSITHAGYEKKTDKLS